jgi:hypothetical protein
MRLYHKDGVHLNLSGSYKLAENIGIPCKTLEVSLINVSDNWTSYQKRAFGFPYITIFCWCTGRQKCFFTYMYLSILIIGGYRLNGVSKSFVFCFQFMYSYNESNSDVQCICKGTGKSILIQCSWCQMWLHVTSVNLSEKETIGFTCSLSMLLISNSVICEGVSSLFISFSIVKLSFRVFAETVSSIFSSPW